jgi:hypothetical protein
MEDHLKKQMIYDPHKEEEIDNTYSGYTAKSGMIGIKIEDPGRFKSGIINKFGNGWEKKLLGNKQWVRHYTHEQLYRIVRGLY